MTFITQYQLPIDVSVVLNI